MKPYYDEDGITIYHGDCREMLQHMAADVVVTDPPYGIGYVHGAYAGGYRTTTSLVPVYGDAAPYDPSPILALSLPTVLWGGNHYADRLPASPGWLVWDKRVGRGSTDQADCEIAWTNFLTVARVHSRYWGGAVRGGEEQGVPAFHPTQKPVGLMRWVLGLCPPGSVIDPYMGSGTTLVAASELGRRAIGIEIEERYCEIAAQRLSQRTLGLVVGV